jgi:hypothetical protein
MDDIIPQHFHYTLSFLHGLVDNSLPHGGTFDNSLLQSLSDHLKMDGFQIQTFPEESIYHMRRLEGEADTGSALILDIVLIVICVLCAGFASGLTQVTVFSPYFMLYLFFLSFIRVYFHWIFLK